MTAAGRNRCIVVLPALLFAIAPMLLRAQAPAPLDGARGGPKAIALEDYPKFKRITTPAISNDGQWMMYTATPNDGDATLFVKALDGDKIRMRQFFDHYLKGAPAPVWMTDGVPQLRKGLDPTIIAPPTTKKTIR